MRRQCIRAVSAALGRSITLAEARGIEERVRAGMRHAARTNLQSFQSMSTAARLQEGARIAADQIRSEAAAVRRQAVKDVAVHDSLTRYFADWQSAGGDLQDGIDRLLMNNADGRSVVQSLESKIEAVFRDYARRLVTTLEAAHSRMFGLIANKEGAALVTRELFGENTGNATAAAAAREWSSVVDAMVAQFKDAGGVMHRLADWRFPQHHDQARVFGAGGDVSRDAWVADIMPRLDRSKYVTENARLMNDQEVEALLREAWLSIASGGANQIQPGQIVGAGKRANRYTDHRVLHFKDAASWLDYQERFGSGDLWHTMTSHLHRMSRDIALIEALGSNPEAQFRYWQDYAVQQAAGKKLDAEGVRRRLDDAYRFLAGQTDGVANATVAAVFDNTRNVLSAARLGSAVISSIPDLATMMMTARYNRISGLEAYANGLRSLGSEGRAQLQQTGLMIESALGSLRRFQVDALGPTYTARLAEATMRAQGLDAWTQGLRGGFGATQMHALAKIVDGATGLASLDPADAKLLRAAGVTDVDIQVWAKARPAATRFGNLLTPDSIYAIPDADVLAVPVPVNQVTRSADEIRRQAAQRLLGLTLSESHLAVTEPGARERLQMSAGRPRGELKGELLRSFWQFKSFPWALFQKHVIQRGLGAYGTAGGKVTYVGGLTIASTLLGALALAVNDMLTGKDPRPMWGDDPKIVARNWGAAFLKGGAMGVYGDFLATEVSPSGFSPLATALGPVGGLAHDVLALTAGNAVQLAGGKDTNAGVEAARMVRGLTPGSSLWYAKAALDHLIYNQVLDAMNPDYLRRVRRRAESQFGTEYFWPPSSPLPQRAPDLTNIGGR